MIGRWTWALAATLAAALVIAVGACGDNESDQSSATIDAGGEAVAVSALEDAANALCTARDQARTDVEAAETTFYDRSHDALHTMARALEPVDRAQAARLLEDKQRVEAAFAGDPSAAAMAHELDRLARVTRAGLAALAVSVPECQ